MIEKKLSGALQENIITLAVFDKTAIPLLMNSVDIELFSTNIYRDIAEAAFDYYRQFKKPAENHISDLLEPILQNKSTTETKSKAKLYKATLMNIYESKDSVNREYVLSELANFIKQQQLIIGVKKAALLLKSNRVDEAEIVMAECRKKQLAVFDPGIRMANHEQVLECLNVLKPSFNMDIATLDHLSLGPERGQLWALAARPNAGKSWAGSHILRAAIKQRYKVLHLTLEMSEEQVAQRYLQSIFGISKRDEMMSVPIFERNEKGLFFDLDFKKVSSKMNFVQKDIKSKISAKLKKHRNLQNLTIKQFPSGMLTVTKLRAYLENLIHYEGFMPDIIFVDYPRCMKNNPEALTATLGQTYIDLRGIAVEYNIAIVVVAQINRSGGKVKWLTADHLAEDYSLFFTADNLLTFNQTEVEARHGLARLFVVKGRGDKKGQQILISQNYGLGQFCIDSVLMNNGIYDDILRGGFDEED